MGLAGKTKAIWLHIGTEKTGSTSIQNACMKNRALLARAGVLYPDTPLLGSVQAHPGLVHFAAEDGDEVRLPRIRTTTQSESNDLAEYRDSFVERLRGEIVSSGCGTVVMSSEHLYSRLSEPASVNRLIASLSAIADHVRVIVYLRPQYQLLPSLYSTQVKGGRVRPPVPLTRIKDRLYNYNAMLERWEAAAGVRNVSVRRFGPAYFEGGGLLEDFFSAIGVALPEGFQVPEIPRNQALDSNAIEFLRIANQAIAKQGRSDKTAWFAMIKGLEGLSDRKAAVISPDLLAGLDAMYRDSNAAIAQRHFPELGRDLFPPFAANGAQAPSGLTVEKAVGIAVRLWMDRSRQLAEVRDQRKAKIAAASPPDPIDDELSELSMTDES